MKTRIILLFVAICSLWALVVARALYIQVLPNARLSDLQSRQFSTVVTLEPKRGMITDRNGKELAASVSAWSLYADPKIIENKKLASVKLAKILAENPNHIYAKISDKKKRFVWLERRLSLTVKEEVEKLEIRGLAFVEESKRVYPNQNLASQLIGFVGREGKGLEGVEMKFQDELYGAKRSMKLQKDARGRPLVVNGQIFSESLEGYDVQLTVDHELQYRLEQELIAAKNDHQADAAVGVILDAKTSEVLALANVPGYDPNEPADSSSAAHRNRVMTDPFEPGSTMKTFVLATALKDKKIQPNTKIYCENGKMKIGKRIVREADSKHNFEWLTVSEILAVSSNIGTTKVAFQLGDEKLRSGLQEFGFFQKTGLELPGESRGILPALPWREHLLSNISFGHGVAATPIQIANAYAAIANGGMLNQPYIVKKISSRDQGMIEEHEPKTLRRVLSTQDAGLMTLMLKGVTSDGGTGITARVNGYPVAGKTGTAQKADPIHGGYLNKAYISSFAGFIPANDPKYVIYIAVDNPRKGYYGAEVAGPVFSRVASYAVRHAGIAPVLVNEKDLMQDSSLMKNVITYSETEKKGVEKVSVLSKVSATTEKWERVPDLRGLSLREVMSKAQEQNVELKVSGNTSGSGVVIDTWPSQGQEFTSSRQLHITLHPE